MKKWTGTFLYILLLPWLVASSVASAQNPPARPGEASTWQQPSVPQAAANTSPSESSPTSATPQADAPAAQEATAPADGITWKSTEQKENCGKILEVVRDHFQTARFYSIQGDSCRTAFYAEKFMETVDACRKECPDNLLEKSGFNAGIVRNLNTLHELGSKRCADGK